MKYILSALLLLSATTSFGSSEYIPLETVVTNSDLIVVATLTKVQQLTSNDRVYCQGELKVAEVLKEFRYRRNVKSVVLKWVYGIPPNIIELDRSNLEGTSLLWILNQEKDKSFSAYYKEQVQNIDKKDDIKKIITNHNQ